MWTKIKEANEERGQYLADMKAILTKAETEKRDLTPAEDVTFNELNTKAESRKAQIERYEKTTSLEATIASKRDENRQQPGRDNLNTPEQETDRRAKEQRSQVLNYLRNGIIESGETRALSISGSGIVGDRPIYNQLITSIKTFAGVRLAGCTVLPTTDGNDLSIPTGDDTSNTGQIVGEGATDNTAADPTVGVLTLKAFKYDSKWIKVSREMLQDSSYPLEAYILGIAGERIGRIFNSHTTTGTGTGQPKGFLVAGGSGKVAAATNAITYDEILDLIHSVDAGYRASPTFCLQLHDTTLAAIRKLKDGAGRYIFTAGAAGVPSLIGDAKFVVNNSMPQLSDGVSSKVLAAGDFSRYFVRDVANVDIVRANELFVGDGLVGFRIFARHDGNLTDAAAVKYLKLAAA